MINKQMREGCSLPEQAAEETLKPSNCILNNPTRHLKVLNFSHFDSSLTQAGLAVEYAKMGLHIFPCNKDKSPIVDQSLGFKHGVKDATNDVRRISRTWFKYPDAAIGFAISPDIIVIDCDVRKDSDKRPLLKNGLPDMIGLKSFQRLVMEFNMSGDPLYTLSVSTKSRGRHFYFRMPEGIPSFNHTAAMEGLDLKGFGGYVILPNSQGAHGKYEFLNLTEIKPVPESLLEWILKFKKPNKEFKTLPFKTSDVDRESIVRILIPYWDKANGRRNELTLAIAGFIARSGGAEEDAVYILNELAKRTLKGSDHVPGARYSFHRNGKIKGLTTLKKLIEELGND